LPKPDGQHDPTDRRPSKVEFIDNFDNARQAALDSGRPLIISFSRPGCGACTQLDSQAWPNQTALVNDNAIRVKLNGSRNQELAQRYGVTAYPTTVVVNPRNMDVLQKARGAISSAELSGMLQDAFRKYRGG
jgi:thioredoxin-related protein